MVPVVPQTVGIVAVVFAVLVVVLAVPQTVDIIFLLYFLGEKLVAQLNKCQPCFFFFFRLFFFWVFLFSCIFVFVCVCARARVCVFSYKIVIRYRLLTKLVIQIDYQGGQKRKAGHVRLSQLARAGIVPNQPIPDCKSTVGKFPNR